MITPNIPLSIDQLVFTPTEAMLELRLEPEQSYSIHLKPIEDVYGLKLPDTDLSILTPSDKTLALRLTKKVTMFPLDQLPTFRLYAHFKSGDPEAKPEYALNLCKVTLEKYALFERLIRYANNSDTGSYITALKDKKGMLDCREKIVRVGTGAITPFDLSDSSGSMLTTGLYVISFKDPKDIAFDGRINTPILFSVVDSHITMKISKKGKAFFFVTDIATGKPIANQQITIMKNIGDLYKRTWNEASGSYDVAYYPLSHKVFDDPIVLGNTDKDGILSVDIDNKLKASSYGLSFEEWW